MLCLSLHFVFVDSWISSCCCILRVIYISWCIFLCLGVCWVYCIYFKFSLFCVSPFLSLILSVALVFIFSVFAFVFLVLCLSPPCVPFIESVSSQCLFPPSSCVRSVSCFILPVCVLCALCSALPPLSCQCAISVSSGPSSPHPVYVSLPLTVAASSRLLYFHVGHVSVVNS